VHTHNDIFNIVSLILVTVQLDNDYLLLPSSDFKSVPCLEYDLNEVRKITLECDENCRVK
jgi:hypothetical protein